MKTALEHLPEKQQAELARVRSILLAEFEVAKAGRGGGAQPWRRDGHVQKIMVGRREGTSRRENLE
ncbi:hypothetical protein [Caulobacter sp. DWR3-1-2]|uniref:hypothetical protein n=1 Tax=Caulobacter sp. DWR3-1-2 TaxID=2804647 RepID=UPI003CEC7EA5